MLAAPLPVPLPTSHPAVHPPARVRVRSGGGRAGAPPCGRGKPRRGGCTAAGPPPPRVEGGGVGAVSPGAAVALRASGVVVCRLTGGVRAPPPPLTVNV